MDLIQKVKKNIKKYNLFTPLEISRPKRLPPFRQKRKSGFLTGFSPKDTLVLAVSGGVDSVVLLDAMCQVSSVKRQRLLVVAHLNHSLRGKDSELDQKFVAELAKKYKLKFETKKIDIRKIAKKTKRNLEEVAREERYKFLAQVAQKHKTQRIVTAHHADDQVETVILNYLRGADYQGLSGMGYINEYKIQNTKYKILRPLLNIWRKEILEYQQKNNLSFRQDKSNSDIKIKRNYLRLKLIPELEKKDKDFKRKIWLKVDQLKEIISYIEPKIIKIYHKVQAQQFRNAVVLDIDKFNDLPSHLRAEVLKIALNSLGDLKNVSKKHILDTLRVIKNRRVSKIIVLPNRLRVVVDYDNVILLSGEFPKARIKKKKLKIGRNIISENGLVIGLDISQKIASKSLNYDLDKISFPLYIRSVEPGDSFRPKGFQGTKKLQDLFVDLKIPQRLRNLLPVIVDKNGTILEILGVRQGQEASVAKNTKKILKIDFEEIKI